MVSVFEVRCMFDKSCGEYLTKKCYGCINNSKKYFINNFKAKNIDKKIKTEVIFNSHRIETTSDSFIKMIKFKDYSFLGYTPYEIEYKDIENKKFSCECYKINFKVENMYFEGMWNMETEPCKSKITPYYFTLEKVYEINKEGYLNYLYYKGDYIIEYECKECGKDEFGVIEEGGGIYSVVCRNCGEVYYTNKKAQE